MAERKQARTRIDAICNAIRKGEYDDKLAEIQKAVSERTEVKRKELLALVQEVYGPNATIQQHLPSVGGTFPRGVAINSSGQPPWPESIDLGGQQTEASALDAVEDETTAQDAAQVIMPPEGPDENGFESRSPVIGPVNPS